MGLLLRADAEGAPEPDDPFLVVDELLRVRAVSRRAEQLLGMAEVAAVDHHLGEFLVPADLEAEEGGSLADMVRRAVFEGQAPVDVVLRPRDAYGARLTARIAPCTPGPAAVVVIRGAN